ncbi:MAG TPA: zf-HC2 domain-containing protein [Pyrinomonadaceae bacterium]|jgi:anti-sigma factor RsiW
MMPRSDSDWRAKLPCISQHKRNLSAYLDGELEGNARAGVEDHLSSCYSCRAEYQELRLASRALSYFVVPESSPPNWQPALMAQRSRDNAPVAALKRCFAMKVAVPVPVFAGLLVAIILAAWLLLMRPGLTARSVPAPSASADAPPAAVIEVPVEREVVRERVVTRVIYSRRARPSPASRRRTAEEELRGTTLIAGRRPAADVRGANAAAAFTRASLAGFRPARTADLRIVKEPQP